MSDTPADNPNPVDVFEMMLKPDPDTFRAPRLQLGLLLDTLHSYVRVNKQLKKNPTDALALQSADMMEAQLIAAAACLYSAVPPEDRKALRFEALKMLVEHPDRLPELPKLEDMD